jgi:L-asparaginase
LAKLGVSIELAEHVLPPRKRQAFDGRLEARVLAVRLFPGLNPQLLMGALDTGVRGLVIKAFGAGNVPTLERSMVPVIARATSRDIPVVVVSQCLHAHVDLSAYAGGAAARDAGAIGAGDMTDEAALTKLMVTLGRAEGEPAAGVPRLGRVQAAAQAFAVVLAGEMTVLR